jgi:hypothetical protein
VLDAVPLFALPRCTDVAGANPTRPLSLQPEAPGADQEATNGLNFGERAPFGGGWLFGAAPSEHQWGIENTNVRANPPVEMALALADPPSARQPRMPADRRLQEAVQVTGLLPPPCRQTRGLRTTTEGHLRPQVFQAAVSKSCGGRRPPFSNDTSAVPASLAEELGLAARALQRDERPCWANRSIRRPASGCQVKHPTTREMAFPPASRSLEGERARRLELPPEGLPSRVETPVGSRPGKSPA